MNSRYKRVGEVGVLPGAIPGLPARTSATPSRPFDLPALPITPGTEPPQPVVVGHARAVFRDVSLIHAYASGFALPARLRVQFHQPEQPRMTGEDITQ